MWAARPCVPASTVAQRWDRFPVKITSSWRTLAALRNLSLFQMRITIWAPSYRLSNSCLSLGLGEWFKSLLSQSAVFLSCLIRFKRLAYFLQTAVHRNTESLQRRFWVQFTIYLTQKTSRGLLQQGWSLSMRGSNWANITTEQNNW